MINISCLQSWTRAVWAFKSFLYTNPSFLSISAGFARRLSVFPQGHSQLPLCLSQFCLCPLGVRLLSAQSPVPGISRRTREARAGVAFLGCSLASGFYPERANWLLWSHQTGFWAGFVPGFTSWDCSRATAHPWAAE